MAALPESVSEEIRGCVAEQLLRKVMHHKQDEVGLVIAGTEATHNNLAAQHEGHYEHLTQYMEVRKPTLDDIKNLKAVDARAGGAVDMVETLILAADLLNTRIAGKYRFRKRVFYYTGAGDEVEKKDDLPALIQGYASQDIELTVVGVDFHYETAEEAAVEEDWDTLSTKRANEKVIYHLLKTLQENPEMPSMKNHYNLTTRSICIPLPDVLANLAAESIKSVRQVSCLSKMCIEFGEDDGHGLSIPVVGFVKSRKADVGSFEKVSKKARALDADATAGVDIERRYFLVDKPDEEVAQEDVVKAYRYGCSLVPFTEVDDTMLKFDGGIKSMKVLAFIPKASVRRHHFLSQTYCLTNPTDDTNAEAALSALIHAMHETATGMILRLVRRSYEAPTIALAWPHLTAKKTSLWMAEVGFAEDYRTFDFPAFSAQYAPSAEQLKAADALIDAMDLTDISKAEEEEDKEEGACHRVVFNPQVQYMQSVVRARLFKPDCEIPDVPARVAKTCRWESEDSELYEFFEQTSADVRRFNQACGSKLSDKLAKANPNLPDPKKSYWFAGGAGGPPAPAAGVPSVPGAVDPLAPPPPKPVGFAQSSNSAAYPSTLDTTMRTELGVTPLSLLGDGVPMVGQTHVADAVSTMTPVEDFMAMVKRTDGDFVQKALDGMRVVVRQLVQDSIGSQLYGKALHCITTLRTTCVHEDEPKFFNGFMREIKAAFSVGKRAAFWEMVKEAGVTLISTDDCDGADATPEAARGFLALDDSEDTAPVVASAKDDDDDLFDMLA
eukprot:TRINITY_DN18130_c0_g1_i1.p2 TRINITY_DN18130_c0_g1~~TRINITY_DN18130_c0_g1_i1.p2  ORF type:complete len:814 (+),score=333.55 TRINITY_DN18130_c0_g1_i1:102-2444(+)